MGSGAAMGILGSAMAGGFKGVREGAESRIAESLDERKAQALEARQKNLYLWKMQLDEEAGEKKEGSGMFQGTYQYTKKEASNLSDEEKKTTTNLKAMQEGEIAKALATKAQDREYSLEDKEEIKKVEHDFAIKLQEQKTKGDIAVQQEKNKEVIKPPTAAEKAQDRAYSLEDKKEIKKVEHDFAIKLEEQKTKGDIEVQQEKNKEVKPPTAAETIRKEEAAKSNLSADLASIDVYFMPESNQFTAHSDRTGIPKNPMVAKFLMGSKLGFSVKTVEIEPGVLAKVKGSVGGKVEKRWQTTYYIKSLDGGQTDLIPGGGDITFDNLKAGLEKLGKSKPKTETPKPGIISGDDDAGPGSPGAVPIEQAFNKPFEESLIGRGEAAVKQAPEFIRQSEEANRIAYEELLKKKRSGASIPGVGTFKR